MNYVTDQCNADLPATALCLLYRLFSAHHYANIALLIWR